MRSGELERQPTQTLDESLLIDPEESGRPLIDFLGSTPGRMALAAVVLVAALLGVGVTASTTVSHQQRRLETLRSHTEPLADAAQRIYGALSFANTTAATSFLSGGVETNEVRDRYNTFIGEASAGLITASNGVSPNDIQSLALLTDLSNQLAVYTGTMATARANLRAGHPIGVSYLSESSAMMQHSMLPAAERLYRTQSDAVIVTGRLRRVVASGGGGGCPRIVSAVAGPGIAGSSQSSSVQPGFGAGLCLDRGARGVAEPGRAALDTRLEQCADARR